MAQKRGVRRGRRPAGVAQLVGEAMARPYNPIQAMEDALVALLTPVVSNAIARAVSRAGIGAGLPEVPAGDQQLVQTFRIEGLSSSTGAEISAGGGCKSPGCQNPARCKGLCSKHYQAARRRQVKRRPAPKPVSNKPKAKKKSWDAVVKVKAAAKKVKTTQPDSKAAATAA